VRFSSCLIAATCLEAKGELFLNDRVFEAIAKVERLDIYRLQEQASKPLRWWSPSVWPLPGNRLYPYETVSVQLFCANIARII